MDTQNSKPNLTVQTGTPDDWMAIAHLNVWAHREFAFDLGAEVWPAVVLSLTSVGPTAGHSQFLVVRDGDALAGSVAYRPPDPAGRAAIELLSVSPDSRREGIGTALVAACMAKAGADRAHRLEAAVHDYMPAAQALFTALGWHREQGLAKRGEPPFWLYLSPAQLIG